MIGLDNNLYTNGIPRKIVINRFGTSDHIDLLFDIFDLFILLFGDRTNCGGNVSYRRKGLFVSDWQFVGVIFLCRQDFYLIWGSAVSTVKDSYGTKRKARPTRQYGSFNRLRKTVVARCVSMLIAI